MELSWRNWRSQLKMLFTLGKMLSFLEDSDHLHKQYSNLNVLLPEILEQVNEAAIKRSKILRTKWWWVLSDHGHLLQSGVILIYSYIIINLSNLVKHFHCHNIIMYLIPHIVTFWCLLGVLFDYFSSSQQPLIKKVGEQEHLQVPF